MVFILFVQAFEAAQRARCADTDTGGEWEWEEEWEEEEGVTRQVLLLTATHATHATHATLAMLCIT